MILEGLTEQGAVVPVQVTDQGRLVAEGLQGPQGPPGEGVSLWSKNGSDLYYNLGKVGLGTSTPSAVLDVSGNSKTSTLQIGTNPAGISVACLGIPNQKRIYGRNAANTGDVNILYIDSSNGMVFGPGDAAVIDSSGRLGIGTTSPSAVVHAARTGDSVYFKADSDSVSTVYGSASALSTGLLGTFTNHPLSFYTNSSERARIDTSGRLLVGTVSAPGSAPAGSVSCTGGVYLKSPNGSWWKIAVSDSGALSAVAA